MAHVRFSTAPSGSSQSSLAAADEGGTRRSTGVGRRSGPASAAIRPASPSSRGMRRGTSSFASFFASYGSSSMANPRSRRFADGPFSADSSSATGDTSRTSPNRMTIRVIARGRGAGSNRRTTETSGNVADPDEPIIIE